MNITQPVCVFVALGIQHAMRMRHIIICGLPCSRTLFPHYLIIGMIFEKKKFLNINCVFRVSLQLLSETIFQSKMYIGLHAKCRLVILVRF
jgi:hypothetical protein